MSCIGTCEDENTQQDAYSPGPIGVSEYLCRAGYGKTAHYNSSTVRPSLIRPADLLEGKLSVWRLDGEKDKNLPEILGLLRDVAPPNNQIYDIFAATAGSIRAIRAPSHPETQALHAYDDCTIDNFGKKNASHAVLAICNSLNIYINGEKDSPTFVEIRELLFNLLKEKTLWSLEIGKRK